MRKRELEAQLVSARLRIESLHEDLVEAQAAIARERKDALERVERLAARHAAQVDTLVAHITSPQQAALYARSRELEMLADDAGPPVYAGPDDEPSVGEKRRLAIGEQLAQRGITQADMDAAVADEPVRP